jgi:hypothetical protein
VHVAEFRPVPRDDPLAYPGRYHQRSFVLAGDQVLDLEPDPGALDALLERQGAVPLAARTAVLAVGSNASPAQLHRKVVTLSTGQVVPVLQATVTGLVIGFSRHITVYGAIPMTPMTRDGATTTAFVTFLDADQLAVVTTSEGANYELVRYRADGNISVTSADGAVVADVSAFVTTRGLLHLDGEAVVAPVSQAQLWERLATAWAPRPEHAGLPATPAAIVEALRTDAGRTAIVDAFDAVTAPG